jgi:rhomboid protease GluP
MRATHVLVAVNVLLWIAMLATGQRGDHLSFTTRTLVDFGAHYGPLVLREREWFRWVTATFIHLGPAHLGFNMLALLQVGALIEPHFGRWRYLLLYFLAAFGGWGASLLWNLSHPVVSAGASGAISGLIGAGALAGHLAGGAQGVKVRDAMLRWAAFVLVFGLLVPVDNAAHVGGFVTGALVALVFDAGGRAARRTPEKPGPGTSSIVVVLLVGLCFALAARAREGALTAADWIARGATADREGRNKDAEEAFRRAVRLEPESGVAHYDLGLLYLRRGAVKEAVAELKEAVRLEPKQPEGWSLYAEALEADGDHAGAEEARRTFRELGGRPDAGVEADGGSPAPDGG